MNEIVLILTQFGEFIGEYDEEKEVLKHPYRLIIGLSPEGKVGFNFLPLGVKELYLVHIGYAFGEVEEEIKKSYLSARSGLTIASIQTTPSSSSLSQLTNPEKIKTPIIKGGV